MKDERICQREGCEQSLEGKRSDAKWCSRSCGRYGTRSRARQKHPIRHLLYCIKGRAKKADIPFDLKVGDIEIPDKCPVLGIPLEWSANSPSPASPSVDRLVPELGYISTNIRIISYRANTIKTDASVEELRAVADWLEEELADAS